MRASSFHPKKDGLAERSSAQLDLFDRSVFEHTEVARLLCIRRAPKARCMMMIETAPKVRKTYPQQWPAYNKAQVNEKSQLQSLLYELCQSIEEPPQVMGRPRAPLSDVVFASCLKVYECMSGRRNQSDVREALQRGYLRKPVHYNTISKYLEREELTPLLK